MFRQYDYRRFDYFLLILMISLVIFGIIVIGSARTESVFITKQIIGLVVGIIVLLIVSFIDYHTLGNFYWAIYFINIVMLLLVLFLGEESKGATRWISIGFLTIQPSEFNKIFMTVFMAKFFDKNQDRINSPYFWIQIIGLVSVPMFLIKEQPDLSTSLVLIFILIFMLFIAGLNYKYIFISFAVIAPMLYFFIQYIQQPTQKLLKSYQRNRILSFIDPSKYTNSLAYQQQNSVLALGSGQLHGKGLYNGTVTTVKNANFILEPQTDFIFSIIGEELGFIGCSIVLFVLFLIIIKLILIAKDSKDLFGTLIITGMVAIITFQTFINVGVAIFIVPNTGIPLPFVSYGLSSLLSLMIGIGIVLNISMQRKRLMGRG